MSWIRGRYRMGGTGGREGGGGGGRGVRCGWDVMAGMVVMVAVVVILMVAKRVVVMRIMLPTLMVQRYVLRDMIEETAATSRRRSPR